MGIPHLTAQIRPYAEPISWKIQLHSQAPVDNALAQANVIIDGPSFAYYIYHHCPFSSQYSGSAFNGIPSYEDIVKHAVAWLDELESFGLHVKHIFFDGFLPRSKISTRYERLSKNLIQLRAFRSTTSEHATGRTMHLPAPPFLVSAISDGLSTSKYVARVQTVACEAESHCIDGSVVDEDDIILTNDSDLILLAQKNRVMFFNDIEVRSCSETDKSLRGECYDGTKIRKELRCDDLVIVGYMLSKHPNTTLKDLGKRAEQDQGLLVQTDAGYKLFRQQYVPQHQYSPFAWATDGTTTMAEVLRHLDARVSEFVNDWGSYLGDAKFPLLGHCSKSITCYSEMRHMFLLFLLDDPVRSSAWRASSEIRRLAYSILALYGPHFGMMEVDRRGDRITSVPIPLVSGTADVSEACHSMKGKLPSQQQTLSSADTWRLFSISQVLLWIKDQSSSLPSRAQIRNVCITASAFPDWDSIHLSAQIQGYLYSLRILKQTLDVYVAAGIEINGLDVQVLRDLQAQLQGLPPVAKVMPRPGGSLGMDESNLPMLDSILQGIYPADVGREENRSEKVKRKKKRNRENEAQNSAKIRSKAGTGSNSNPYEILADI